MTDKNFKNELHRRRMDNRLNEVLDAQMEQIKKRMERTIAMSEKRGYPNPNYTEGDIMPGIPMEVRTELLLDDQLVEYIQKAAMFDCLASTIKTTGKIDDDVVRALTGTNDPKEHEDIIMYRSWYNSEKQKNEELQKEIERLEIMVEDLQKPAEDPKEAEGPTGEEESKDE